MVDDAAEGLYTQKAFTDLLVSVFMGTARILRVVQVQCPQSVQADHPVKLGQHPVQILCQRVPAIAHMTGIQAHADLVLQLHTVYNAAQLLKGAREHNLKNIDVEIPRDKLVVFTGLSGSGKSSLAFDTIYAEGQRRYVESLSSYARQFLGQMEKPDVDYIEGLSPAISIDQKTTSRNPRSTVGTVTEIYDYLRLLWARIGIPHCPVCGREITQQTVDQIVDQILTLPEKTKIQIMAPIVRGHKGEYVKELDNARKSGFVRARIDGSVYDLAEEIKLDKNKKQKHHGTDQPPQQLWRLGIFQRVRRRLRGSAALLF